ncbi:MAG: Ribonuclease [Bacteroidota bacterium]|jgi:ribonuclease P protein component
MKKKYILRKKSDIEDVFSKGKYISNNLFTIKYFSSTETKFLFTVSSKKYKKAVDRNLIKRRLKMITSSVKLKKCFNVAIIFKNDTISDFETMKKSLESLFILLK